MNAAANLTLRQKLVYLFAQLERALPHPAGLPHTLHLYGFELAVSVTLPNKDVKMLFLDDEDLTGSLDVLVANIVKLVRA